MPEPRQVTCTLSPDLFSTFVKREPTLQGSCEKRRSLCTAPAVCRPSAHSLSHFWGWQARAARAQWQRLDEKVLAARMSGWPPSATLRVSSFPGFPGSRYFPWAPTAPKAAATTDSSREGRNTTLAASSQPGHGEAVAFRTHAQCARPHAAGEAGPCGLGSAPERPAPLRAPPPARRGQPGAWSRPAEPGRERLGTLRRGRARRRWPQERLPRGRGVDAARGRK